MAKLSLTNQAYLRWDSGVAGISTALSPMPRISGGREEAAEIQS